jgi:hypothetical protein
MPVPPQLGFAESSNQPAQVFIVEEGNIVPGDFKHGSKLGKPQGIVNHRWKYAVGYHGRAQKRENWPVSSHFSAITISS